MKSNVIFTTMLGCLLLTSCATTSIDSATLAVAKPVSMALDANLLSWRSPEFRVTMDNGVICRGAAISEKGIFTDTFKNCPIEYTITVEESENAALSFIYLSSLKYNAVINMPKNKNFTLYSYQKP